MIKLYTSTTGIVHWVRAGYICNAALGKVTKTGEGLTILGKYYEGTRDEITCKNCRGMLN